MAKLFIPACGDRIVLAAPWKFTLHLERRNHRFAKELKLVEASFGKGWHDGYVDGDYHKGLRTVPAELPAGTVLEFDRLYIRQFNKTADEDGFDSVTLKVIRNGKAVRNQRFWVKLSDACEVEYGLEQDSLYRERVKAVRAVLES